MRIFMAEHSAIGRGKGGERQRIGRRSRGHKKYGAITLEDFADLLLGCLRPVVRAIGQSISGIGGKDSVEDLLRCPTGIVAGEIHALTYSRSSGDADPPRVSGSRAFGKCQPGNSRKP